MLPDDFDRTLDFWIKELDQYNFNQLCAKPSPNSWSLGQVYMHLIENTDWFFEQVKICASTNDHAMEQASPDGKTMLLKNAFPDESLDGPPENADTPQPESKNQLMISLLNLKNEIRHIEVLISRTPFKGKTKHPGLGYFSATEWFQFAEMHLRHHLRQKKRLDGFLNVNEHKWT